MHAVPKSCDCGSDHEALTPIEEACFAAAACVPSIAGRERVSLAQCLGRVLAEDVHALIPMPRFDQSAMDGYALAAASASIGTTLLPVTLRILAGDAPLPLPEGSAARIFTGAPLPAGADVVVMQEQAERRCGMVAIAGPQRAGNHVRLRGEDVNVGERLLAAGTRVDARHIALLAAQGVTDVAVRRRARVAVISTGSELRQPGVELPAGAIYDSNRPMLMALAAQAGADVIDGGCLPDDTQRLTQVLAQLVNRADIIISSAGASVGDEDNSLRAAHAAGFDASALRLAMKPGKPAVIGKSSTAAYLGLPGNPLSAFVSWTFLGKAMLARLQGRDWRMPQGFAVASANRFGHKPGRTEFVPARLTVLDGRQMVQLLGHGVSAHLKPLAAATGLAQINLDQGHVEAGDMVHYMPFDVLGQSADGGEP